MINRLARDGQAFYRPMPSSQFGTGVYEDLAIDGTVRAPTPPQYALMAKIFFRGSNVRATFHGVNPSSVLGVPFYDGYEEWFSLDELNVMKMIREGATNGEAHIVYYW